MTKKATKKTAPKKTKKATAGVKAETQAAVLYEAMTPAQRREVDKELTLAQRKKLRAGIAEEEKMPPEVRDEILDELLSEETGEGGVPKSDGKDEEGGVPDVSNEKDGEEGEGTEDGDDTEDGEPEKEEERIEISVVIDPESEQCFIKIAEKGDESKTRFLQIITDPFSEETRYAVDVSADAEVHIKDLGKYVEDGSFARGTVSKGKKIFVGLNDRVAQLRTRLVMDLQSIGRHFERNLETGRLDTHVLHRPFIGDARVFSKKIKKKTINTAVSVLGDCSGSMNGDPFDTMIQLNALFCDALEMAGVPCESLGFTTHYNARPAFGLRREALLHIIFKDFRERALLHRNEWYNANGVLANNVDGEAVIWAAKRLAARPEARKVLFVLSDGYPAGAVSGRGSKHFPKGSILYEHLKESVELVEQSGIEVIGVGIQSDAPKHFYKRFVLYRDLDDLMTGFYANISSLLRSGVVAA
jgi:cobalamin biosynthesis protein CobT